MARQGLENIRKLQKVKHEQVIAPEAVRLEMGILYQAVKKSHQTEDLHDATEIQHMKIHTAGQGFSYSQSLKHK